MICQCLADQSFASATDLLYNVPMINLAHNYHVTKASKAVIVRIKETIQINLLHSLAKSHPVILDLWKNYA